MASKQPGSVKEYLDGLPDDRRKALQVVRKEIKANLGKGFKEGIMYGTIGYFVPLTLYPAGYGGNPDQPLPFLGLASNKNNMVLTLMHFYADPAEDTWFRKEWAKTGKKLDLGKGCLRFKKLEDLALDVVGKGIARVSAEDFANKYDAVRNGMKSNRKAKKKSKEK